VLERVAGIWNSAALFNKLRIQGALFPKGLSVSKRGFGTDSIPSFFKQFGELQDTKGRMASLVTASWNQIIEWLKRIETLREFVGQEARSRP
jgi:hypothetical protein